MKTFILIRGVPGSGKSTVANAIRLYWEQRCGKRAAGPFEADRYMIDADGNYKFDPKRLGSCHEACFKDTVHALKQGYDIVIQSNTNTKKWEYQKYLDAAKEFGYAVQEIVVDGDFGNVHGVPAEKVQQMRDRFER